MRSAREIIQDHIGGDQARLVRYRKGWEGSGHYVPPSEFGKQDARLLHSLMAVRDVIENAMYGPDDPAFRAAVARWAGLEWGGYYDRATFTLREPLPAPPQPELVRGHPPRA
jgi:hypothetical protein